MFARIVLDQEGVSKWKVILARTVGCIRHRNTGLGATGVQWSRSREGGHMPENGASSTRVLETFEVRT